MKIRAFVIVKQDGNFLLIREANPKWKNKWFLPGGNVNDGERILDAAIRETKEESGYDVALNGICFIKFYNSQHPQRGLHVFFSGRIISGLLKKESDEHSIEAAWFDMLKLETLDTRNDLLETVTKYSESIPLLSTEQVEII